MTTRRQKGRSRQRYNHKDKYYFNVHLAEVGDFVETHPISAREAHNIVCAAHMWALDNHVRVHTNKYIYNTEKTLFVVRVTLASNMRERDYR